MSIKKKEEYLINVGEGFKEFLHRDIPRAPAQFWIATQKAKPGHIWLDMNHQPKVCYAEFEDDRPEDTGDIVFIKVREVMEGE